MNLLVTCTHDCRAVGEKDAGHRTVCSVRWGSCSLPGQASGPVDLFSFLPLRFCPPGSRLSCPVPPDWAWRITWQDQCGPWKEGCELGAQLPVVPWALGPSWGGTAPPCPKPIWSQTPSTQPSLSSPLCVSAWTHCLDVLLRPTLGSNIRDSSGCKWQNSIQAGLSEKRKFIVSGN